MKILSADKNTLVLQPSKTNESYKSFMFDIDIVPDKTIPKKIIIQKKVGRYLRTWSMSWRKFGKQTCIGNVALIDKSEFTYKSERVKR